MYILQDNCKGISNRLRLLGGQTASLKALQFSQNQELFPDLTYSTT